MKKNRDFKVLVIHPYDESTQFLDIIYKDKPYDVITNTTISKEVLKEIMKGYDKIIMLGHGTPSGLINSTWNGLFIDTTFEDIFREKETISIWCNSDRYFKPRNLKGFHTGMIISEVGEENVVLGHAPLNEEEIWENMVLFSKVVGECIEKTPKEMQKYILKHYNGTDEVSQFNRGNIIVIE